MRIQNSDTKRVNNSSRGTADVPYVGVSEFLWRYSLVPYRLPKRKYLHIVIWSLRVRTRHRKDNNEV